MSKNTVLICSIILIGVSYTLYRLHLHPTEFTPIRQEITLKETASPPKKTYVPTESKITIQVSGAVYRPGIYDIAPTARVKEAIALAGGPLPNADLSRLNQVAQVKDGKQYTLPEQKNKTPKASTKKTSSSKKSVRFPINVNVATEDELTQIPGIGTVTAQAILNARSLKGQFNALSDLLSVKGIGTSKLEKISDYLTL